MPRFPEQVRREHEVAGKSPSRASRLPELGEMAVRVAIAYGR